MLEFYMDPSTERRWLHNAHVRAWKLWWSLEGRHFDNGRRHPDWQLSSPPDNAQCAALNVPIPAGFLDQSRA